MTKKILLLFSILAIFFCASQVSAQTVVYKKVSGVYYNQLVNGNLNSGNLIMFHFGNTLAYCVEPGVEILDKDYNSSKDWSQTSFTDEQKKMMEKIGYYGYEYPGHQKPEYFVAAQELIWNISNPNVKVTWSSGKNKTGNILNFEKEKQEILDLVAKDEIRPSFSQTKITGEVGSEIIIDDTNKVLNNYVLSESEAHNLEIKDNQLIVKFNEKVVPKETITLTRKNYDNQVLIVYAKGSNQKLATLRFSSPIETTFEIENKETPVDTPNIPKTPEVVKVPNTDSSFNYLFSFLMLAGGLVIRVKKIL